MIELAYLSALLERVHEGNLSKRFKVIQTFFESAVSVVPLESIFHAMANGKPEVVVQCCEIFSCNDTTLETLTHSSKSLLASMEHALPRIGHFQIKLTKSQYHHKRKILSTGLTPNTVTVVVRASSIDDDDFDKWVRDIKQKSKKNLNKYIELLNKTYSGIQRLMEKCKTGKRRRQQSPCKIDLEVIYPSADFKDTRKRKATCCKAPMTLLTEGKEKLNRLSKESIAEQFGLTEKKGSSNTNVKMLSVVTNLRKEFETCSTLLGAFMESQVQIPLEKAGGDKYVDKVAKHARSIGLSVWGLLILPFQYLNRTFINNFPEDFQQFVVEFSRRFHGIRNYMFSCSEHQFADYDERMEFLVASMKKSVTCNQSYISYSLERQVEDQCKKRNIYHNTPVEEILEQWNDNFEDETLTLVPNEYRRLVARWIKWSLMINNLRESLACQTAIGVIGLVNSGKSKFVRSLFGKEVRK